MVNVYSKIFICVNVFRQKVLIERGIIMNETELIPDGQKDDMSSSSGVSWFITCIIVSILPFMLSYLFKSLSQQEIVSISPYLQDILLIVFPVSCSLLALAYDGFKMIDKKYKKLLYLVGGFSAILSLSYYIFLTGYLKENPDYEDNISIAVSFILIIICTIIGCLSNNNHDKNYEDFRQMINNKYRELSIKCDNLQTKNNKYKDLSIKYNNLRSDYNRLSKRKNKKKG